LRDLQTISLVDDLQITSAEDVVDADPRTLRLGSLGGFNSAQRILINDYAIDAFTKVSDRQLLVPLPITFEGVSPSNMDIVVYSSSLTGFRRARLLFGPTRRVRTVSGLQKLVQQTIRIFLTRMGTNRYRTDEGTNFLRGLGGTLTSAEKPRMAALIAEAASLTEQYMTDAQRGQRGLPAEERLLTFKLLGIEFISVTGEIESRLELISYAGRSFKIPLVL